MQTNPRSKFLWLRFEFSQQSTLQPDALEGTIFKRTVAHGYFVLSRAAGLFVDAPKGPVLLNYGLDECRFTKPIYPGRRIPAGPLRDLVEQPKIHYFWSQL